MAVKKKKVRGMPTRQLKSDQIIKVLTINPAGKKQDLRLAKSTLQSIRMGKMKSLDIDGVMHKIRRLQDNTYWIENLETDE